MNSLVEDIQTAHQSLLDLTNQLDGLLNWLPSDKQGERYRSVATLRGLIPEMEGLLTRCRFDEQDLFASGRGIPLFMRESQRTDQEELQVLLEIVEAESWRLKAAPPIGFLCLLRALCARIRQHVEHENEVIERVDKLAETASTCVN